PIAEAEHEVRAFAPGERETRVRDGAVDILDVRLEILKTRFRGPTAAEIEAAFDTHERNRSDAAFGISYYTIAHDRVCFHFGDLNAERARELAALLDQKAVSVGQAEHREIHLAADALADLIDLVVELDHRFDVVFRRAPRRHAAQAYEMMLAGQQGELALHE